MIRRWLNPILFFAAAFYLNHYNSTHTGSALVFPFIDAAVGPRLEDQKTASFTVLIALGVFTTLIALYDTWRDGQKRSNEG